MNHLSLFTGAGGGDLAHQHLLNFKTIGYVEIDAYCQQILAQRIKDGFLDEAPIFGDINSFIESGAAKKYKGYVDVVTAGFPCPAYSIAGRREGKDSEKNLWSQTIAVIRLLRPHLRYAFLENVPGLLTVNAGEMFAQILSDLAEIGFDARWTCLGADQCGAPHRRRRLWVLADSASERHRRGTRQENGIQGWNIQQDEQTGSAVGSEAEGRSGSRREDVADSDNTGLSQRRWSESVEKEYTTAECGSERQSQSSWPTEPDVGRVAHGVSGRVHRLKGLGNSIVPQIVEEIGRAIIEAEKE